MGFKSLTPKTYKRGVNLPIYFSKIDDTTGASISFSKDDITYDIYIYDTNYNIIGHYQSTQIINFSSGNPILGSVVQAIKIQGIEVDTTDFSGDIIIYSLITENSSGQSWLFVDTVFGEIKANDIIVTQDYGDESTPDNWAGGWVNIDGVTAIRDVRVMAVNEYGVIVDETYTDENGNWSLALYPGKFTIKFRKYGYTFEDKQIEVSVA